MTWQETTISINMNFMIKIVKIWVAFPLNSRDSNFFNGTWYKQNMNELTKNNNFEQHEIHIKILKIWAASSLINRDSVFFHVT